MAITSSDFKNVDQAISAYTQERWTHERRITGTGIVDTNTEIDVTGESRIGQLRFIKEFSPTVNILTEGAGEGNLTGISAELMDYIKCARSIGVEQVNIQKMISKVDGISVFSQNLARSQAKDEHEAIMHVIEGVCAAEANPTNHHHSSGNPLTGTDKDGGLLNFDSDPKANDKGFFIDLNAAGSFAGAQAATSGANARKLFDTSKNNASGVSRLISAIGVAWQDYEPDYMYLLTSPESMADLRMMNLIDEDRVEEGNINFQTILDGKFRLLRTRSKVGSQGGSTIVNQYSTKTTVVVAPGALAFEKVPIEMPVEIDRDASAFQGGGKTELWYRYGFVAHPIGYDWAGNTNAFPSNADYKANTAWNRKLSALNLKILPIFHG